VENSVAIANDWPDRFLFSRARPHRGASVQAIVLRLGVPAAFGRGYGPEKKTARSFESSRKPFDESKSVFSIAFKKKYYIYMV
jgi:hypothetical protein